MLKKIYKLLGVAVAVSMLASLLAVASPAAALSQPIVTLGNPTISQTSTYTVRVTLDKALTTGDTITVTFPTQTTLSGANLAVPILNTDFTIAASQGWNAAGNYVNSVTTSVTAAGSNTAKTVVFTLGAGDGIGEGSEVRIEFLNPATLLITNPSTIDSYTITVATSQETTPMTSNAYSVAAPVIQPLPGIVTLYNPSGIIMNQLTGNGAINTLLGQITASGSTLEIGEGTYVANVAVPAAPGVAGTTIKGVGNVVIKGTFASAATDGVHTTVIDNLTLMPAAAGAPALVITGAMTTVQNCSIEKMTTLAPAGGTLVMLNAATVTLDSCTVDTTKDATADIAVQVNATPVTVSNNDIMVDATVGGTNDVAVDVPGPWAATVTGNTITGSSGIGVQNNANVASTCTITGNTFDALQKAVYVNNTNATAVVTIKDNMIKNSTTVPNVILATATSAVDIKNMVAGSTVTVEQNQFMDNAGLAFDVNSNANAVSFIGNTLSGNAFGVVNRDAVNTLSAILNYWGANSGPTIGTNPDGTGDPIVTGTGYGNVAYTPWSNTSTTNVVANALCPAGGTLDRSTTIGVVYSTTGGATAGIAMMNYSANPAMTDPPGTPLSGGYYDVYSPGAGGAGGTVTLQFFNAGVTTDTKIYYYNALAQSWTMATSQFVAGSGAYVYCNITGATTSPTLAELNGTVFALVTQKSIPSAPVINTPKIGDTNVPIMPLFTWSAVTGAVRYEVTVSDEPSFAIPIISNNADINFFSVSADEALDYDTTYYWRVRAVLSDSYAAGTPATAYQIGIFTTEMKPVDTEAGGGEPVINVSPEKPEVNVSIPPTKITVQPAEAAAIPTYILWIIVVVGAVLIIALIVLIVRTRRA